MTTADAVADYLVALAHERGESVNNLKLQKLLYYAQAWHLALHDEPLFPEKFQAWMTGPVIPMIYNRFDDYSYHDLPALHPAPALGAETERFLDEIADDYMPVDEYGLSWMTYQEAPWRNARGGCDISAPCETEISEEDMRTYFRQMAEAA